MKQRNLFGAIIKSPDIIGVSKARKRKDPPRQSTFVEAARAAAAVAAAPDTSGAPLLASTSFKTEAATNA